MWPLGMWMCCQAVSVKGMSRHEYCMWWRYNNLGQDKNYGVPIGDISDWQNKHSAAASPRPCVRWVLSRSAMWGWEDAEMWEGVLLGGLGSPTGSVDFSEGWGVKIKTGKALNCVPWGLVSKQEKVVPGTWTREGGRVWFEKHLAYKAVAVMIQGGMAGRRRPWGQYIQVEVRKKRMSEENCGNCLLYCLFSLRATKKQGACEQPVAALQAPSRKWDKLCAKTK